MLLVAPALLNQSDLSSHCGVFLFASLVVCLLVDRELNFNNKQQMAHKTDFISNIATRWLSLSY